MARKSASNIGALTSIRGFAAWWVVGYHFREHIPLSHLEFLRKFLDQGYLAVDLFFVLSGFVIFLNYGGWFSHYGFDNLRRFFQARFARVYPLHFVILLLFLLNPLAIYLFSQSHQIGVRYDPTYFVLSLLLIQNWGFVHYLAWNIPSWSISTEWFAYLIFPAFAYFLPKNERRIGITVAVLLFAIVAVAVIFSLANADSIGDDIPELALSRCILEFLAGACICRLRQWCGFTSPLWSPVFLTLAMVLTAFAVESDLATPIVVPTICCLIILGLSLKCGALTHFFEAAPFLFLGEISYSTYMVHYFVKDWVNFLVVKSVQPTAFPVLIYLIAVLVSSILLYRFIEVPGRRFLAPPHPSKSDSSYGGP